MRKLALSCALTLAVAAPSLTPGPADAAARVRVAPAYTGGFPAAYTWFGPLGEPGATVAGQCWKIQYGTSTYMGWWAPCPKR